MRKLFAILAILLAAAASLQLYFAAIGYFSNPDDHLMSIHGFNGQWVLRFLPLLLIIVGLIAKVGASLVWRSAGVIILTLVQWLLFFLSGVIFGSPEENASVPIGATILLGFHGLVGLAIIGLSLELMTAATRLGFPKAADRTPTAP